MGHTHGEKWDEEKIETMLLQMVKTVGLDQMPSRSEMDKFFGNSCLSNAISKRGGFFKYAERLKLEIKTSETAFGKKYEVLIKDKLIDLGYDAEQTAVTAPYDLMVNRRVKIDVKASRLVTSARSPYYTFNLEKKNPTCDFYIAITMDNEDEVKDIYVIPASVMAGKTQLSIGTSKSIYNKYINRWDLIEKLDNTFAEIEAS